MPIKAQNYVVEPNKLDAEVSQTKTGFGWTWFGDHGFPVVFYIVAFDDQFQFQSLNL